VHTLFGSFLPPDTLYHPHLYPSPYLPGRTCSALVSNFVDGKKKHYKGEKMFLLVELRIAIQRDS
jgi:hypothetical protein